MSIALLPSNVRTPADSYVFAVDWSSVDAFAATPVTAGSLSVSTPTGLTLGSVSVASNVTTFRVSGGTAGIDYEFTITVNNGTDYLARTIRSSCR